MRRIWLSAKMVDPRQLHRETHRPLRPRQDDRGAVLYRVFMLWDSAHYFHEGTATATAQKWGILLSPEKLVFDDEVEGASFFGSNMSIFAESVIRKSV